MKLIPIAYLNNIINILLIMLNKLKGKVLENSDSYNELKNENEVTLKKLDKKINKLNKTVKRLEKENNSYNRLFKTLYLDYDIKPKGALKTTFDICQELLNLVDNVCKKHDIEYWLDYGNLLGAIRHGGFIPWDDDIDVGMMRNEFDKFYRVILEELKETGLDEIITITRDKIYGERKVIFFIQISVQDSEGRIFGGLDVFPYDYLIDSFDNIEEEFENTKKTYYDSFFDGVSYEENLKAYYDRMNLSFDKQKYVISGVDSVRAKKGIYNFEILSSDEIFPLKEIEFSGVKYPCPKNSDYYLEKIYGDYMDIPKVLRFHNRLNDLRKSPQLKEASIRYYNILKEVNDSF